jgi:hypothetical protein
MKSWESWGKIAKAAIPVKKRESSLGSSGRESRIYKTL